MPRDGLGHRANLGLFTFAAAALAGPKGRVLAIEPDTCLVELLRRSAGLRSGAMAPVEVLPAAASNETGIGRFCIARRSRSASFLEGVGSSQAGGVQEEQLVPTLTLDGLRPSFPPAPS